MKQVIVQLFVFIALLVSSLGCSSDDKSTVARSPEPTLLLKVPLDLTVRQRTTTVVPGSDEQLSLTIDDITRNQVMVSLATDSGTTILPTRSMSPRDRVALKFAGQQYELVLQELDNALVGDDAAQFSIVRPGDDELSEQEKIDRLIDAVAKLKDATFIRNGTEHSAAEAAEHLRTKWKAAGDQIKTAQEFIDAIASKSSLTGEPYQIRKADGSTIDAAEFFNERLSEMASQASAPSRP